MALDLSLSTGATPRIPIMDLSDILPSPIAPSTVTGAHTGLTSNYLPSPTENPPKNPGKRLRKTISMRPASSKSSGPITMKTSSIISESSKSPERISMRTPSISSESSGSSGPMPSRTPSISSESSGSPGPMPSRTPSISPDSSRTSSLISLTASNPSAVPSKMKRFKPIAAGSMGDITLVPVNDTRQFVNLLPTTPIASISRDLAQALVPVPDPVLELVPFPTFINDALASGTGYNNILPAAEIQHEIDAYALELGFITCKCSKGFDSRIQLQRHVKYYNGIIQKNFHCYHCPMRFSGANMLRNHLLAIHKIVWKNGYNGCRRCGKTFSSKAELIAHQKGKQTFNNRALVACVPPLEAQLVIQNSPAPAPQGPLAIQDSPESQRPLVIQDAPGSQALLAIEDSPGAASGSQRPLTIEGSPGAAPGSQSPLVVPDSQGPLVTQSSPTPKTTVMQPKTMDIDVLPVISDILGKEFTNRINEYNGEITVHHQARKRNERNEKNTDDEGEKENDILETEQHTDNDKAQSNGTDDNKHGKVVMITINLAVRYSLKQ